MVGGSSELASSSASNANASEVDSLDVNYTSALVTTNSTVTSNDNESLRFTGVL